MDKFEMLQRSWTWIRQGMERCRQDPEALETCLARARRNPIQSRWVRILTGQDPEREKEIFQYDNFFEIAGPGRTFWDTQVKNSPFGAIFGRVRLDSGEVVEYDRLKPVTKEVQKALDRERDRLEDIELASVARERQNEPF